MGEYEQALFICAAISLLSALAAARDVVVQSVRDQFSYRFGAYPRTPYWRFFVDLRKWTYRQFYPEK